MQPLDSALPPRPAIPLATGRDRRLFALYLLLWQQIATFVEVTWHEGVHAAAALAVGVPIVGLHLGPAGGEVLVFEAVAAPRLIGLISAVGIPASLLLGYLAAALLLWRPPRGVAAAALLLALALHALILPTIYLAAGGYHSVTSGGDVQSVIRHLGLPPAGFLLGGLALMAANLGLLLYVCRSWFRRYAPQATRRQAWRAMGLWLLLLWGTGILYYLVGERWVS